MLRRVSSRLSTHTNSSVIASSRALSALKLAYYVVFARAYGWSLRQARVVWVNSSWTRTHVEGLVGIERRDDDDDQAGDAEVSEAGKDSRTSQLRQRRRKDPKHDMSATSSTPPRPSTRRLDPPRVRLLYPPCDTLHLSSLPLSSSSRVGGPASSSPIIIFSLAQFRPEKEHPTQLRALAAVLSSPTLSQNLKDRLRLVCAGSVRNDADAERVVALRSLADDLGVADRVDFVVNAGYGEVCEWMGKASVGLHTMVDEHFGITVVEFQVRTVPLRSAPVFLRSRDELMRASTELHRRRA